MTSREKAIMVVAAVLLLALAALVIWQGSRARSAERELAATRSELVLQRHEATVAMAAIEATRGNYELARQLASSFFTGLQSDLDQPPEVWRRACETCQAARPELQQILQPRDAIITALSRSDAQAAPQLVQLLVRYRSALGEPVGPREPALSPQPGAAPPPADSMAGR